MENREEHLTFGFDRRRDVLGEDGWDARRYYSADGLTVREFLAFERVFEINPFEVGVDRRRQKREYAAWRAHLVRELDLATLLPRPFHALSNGEMHRVLFAEILLKRPRRLTLVDPLRGLDPRLRTRLLRTIESLPRFGIDVVCRFSYSGDAAGAVPRPTLAPPKAPSENRASAPGVIEIRNLKIRFGRRALFRGLNWTVHQGERWLLQGPNGSGKTTLLALVTGDCPLAYANDVRVFGIPRSAGCDLPALRRRIAWVSPELQASTGLDAFALLRRALAAEPELLLLDEPCMNLSAREAQRLRRQIEIWLAGRPRVSAVCVVHRPEHLPKGFNRVLTLG